MSPVVDKKDGYEALQPTVKEEQEPPTAAVKEPPLKAEDVEVTYDEISQEAERGATETTALPLPGSECPAPGGALAAAAAAEPLFAAWCGTSPGSNSSHNPPAMPSIGGSRTPRNHRGGRSIVTTISRLPDFARDLWNRFKHEQSPRELRRILAGLRQLIWVLEERLRGLEFEEARQQGFQ